MFIWFAGELFIPLWFNSPVMVESNCQHFGVTGVRWKTGIFTRSRMLGIPLRGGRGRWLCVLFVRNEHLRWTYPRAGQQGSTQSRPVTSKGSYLCESAKDAICLHKQQELTYLRLKTYVGLYRRSDRESNKFTTDNTGGQHNLFGDVFGFEGIPGISSTGYITISLRHQLLHKHQERYHKKDLPGP